MLHKEAVQILQCLAKSSFAFSGFYRAVSWCTSSTWQLATYLQHHLQPDQDIVIEIVFVSVFAFYLYFLDFTELLVHLQLATYLQHHLKPDQDIVLLIVSVFVSVFASVFVFVSTILGFYRVVSAPSVGKLSATPSSSLTKRSQPRCSSSLLNPSHLSNSCHGKPKKK